MREIILSTVPRTCRARDATGLPCTRAVTRYIPGLRKTYYCDQHEPHYDVHRLRPISDLLFTANGVVPLKRGEDMRPAAPPPVPPPAPVVKAPDASELRKLLDESHALCRAYLESANAHEARALQLAGELEVLRNEDVTEQALRIAARHAESGVSPAVAGLLRDLQRGLLQWLEDATAPAAPSPPAPPVPAPPAPVATRLPADDDDTESDGTPVVLPHDDSSLVELLAEVETSPQSADATRGPAAVATIVASAHAARQWRKLDLVQRGRALETLRKLWRGGGNAMPGVMIVADRGNKLSHLVERNGTCYLARYGGSGRVFFERNGRTWRILTFTTRSDREFFSHEK